VDPTDTYALRRAGGAQPARERGSAHPTRLEARSPSAPGHRDAVAGPERVNSNCWKLCTVGGRASDFQGAACGDSGPARRPESRRTSGQRGHLQFTGASSLQSQTAIERQTWGVAAAAPSLCLCGALLSPTRRGSPTGGRRCQWRQGTRKGSPQERLSLNGQAFNGPRCDQYQLASIGSVLGPRGGPHPFAHAPRRKRRGGADCVWVRRGQWGTAGASRPFHKVDQDGCSRSCGPVKMTFVTKASKWVAASPPVSVVGVTREPRAARWSAGGWAS